MRRVPPPENISEKQAAEDHLEVAASAGAPHAEAESHAEAEGLTLLKADNKAGSGSRDPSSSACRDRHIGDRQHGATGELGRREQSTEISTRVFHRPLAAMIHFTRDKRINCAAPS